MELFIETMMGTAFELRVSPFETIMSVKAKIQRLEGIPISQQNLIWHDTVLEDEWCLHDYSIHDGATLRLVLGMRGGPINTRRIPMEDPGLREMAEYMEANKDEIMDKIPGNRQVTLLVFRDGDQLNFFRVVDRGDGTLTPLSESLSGASMYNMCDEEEEVEAEPTHEKVEENTKMQEKLDLLRMKMKDLNLNKKPKKKPRPPSGGRPGSKTRVRYRVHSAKSKKHALNKNTCLPPVGQSVVGAGVVDDSSNADIPVILDPTTAGAVGTVPLAPSFKKHIEKFDSSGGSGVATEMSYMLPSHPPLSASRRKLDAISESAKLRRSLSRVHESGTESPSVPSTSTQKSSGNEKYRELAQIDERPPSSSRRALKTVDQLPDQYKLHSPRPPNSPRKKEVTLDSLKESLRPPTSSKPMSGKSIDYKESVGRPTTSSRKGEVTLESLKESLGRPNTSSRYGLKKDLVLESLSQSEARAMSGLLRQASIERLGSSKIGPFSRSSSRVNGEGRIPTPEGRLVSARLQRLSASRDGRLLSPTHRLPPVKAKKKSGKRCFVCAKKTGLATSYQCRCGNNFCATHRYAESHDCSFDYKTEGRKLLEQSNPVVQAPKLPKI